MSKRKIASIAAAIVTVALVFSTGALSVEEIALGGNIVDPISGDKIPIDIFELVFRYPMRLIIWASAQVSLLFGELDYGIGIVIATVLTKIILMPLSSKSTESMSSKKSDDILEEQQEAVNHYYEGKEDKASTQAKQMDMFKLQRKGGMNIAGGCLPMLLQLPILVIFYQSIYFTPEFSEGMFLGLFELGGTVSEFATAGEWSMAIPALVLALLSGFLTWFMQKQTSANQVQSQDASSQSVMKGMQIVMPIMITLMGITMPTSLTLYWATSNLMMVIQNTIVYRKK